MRSVIFRDVVFKYDHASLRALLTDVYGEINIFNALSKLKIKYTNKWS